MEFGDAYGDVQVPNTPAKSALYVWGYNDSGQTARSARRRYLRIPKRLGPNLFKTKDVWDLRWVDIACGREHTAAVASDGSLFTWANAGAYWYWIACAAASMMIISQVACGATHVAALSGEGILQTWGYNEYGQLGRGVTCEGLQGARIVNSFFKFLDEAPENVKIIQVACGEYHTAAIADNGDVYTWGLGHMGQLGHRSLQYGNKELLPRRVVGLEGIQVRDIACGGVHTCAVTVKGALYIWGGGQAGQLGLGPQNGFLSCVANDSEMFLRNIPVLVVPMGVQLVTCGHSHTLVSMRDGRILGWGYNSYGQAATEKTTYAWYPSPVDWCVGEVRRLAAGGGHSAVLTHAYSLKELCEFKLADSVSMNRDHGLLSFLLK